MGHEIRHLTYQESVDKRRVQADADGMARVAGHQEGSSGLNQPIRWIDVVCEDRESAEDFIKSHDKGWYDQLAVKYREIPRSEPTKTLVALGERYEKEIAKRNAYADAHSVHSFKSEFIGCPSCGSKLKRTLLHGNSCPLCRTELRSKTTMETISRYESNIKNLIKQMEEERKKADRKNASKGKIMWLVKIEYHV